MRETFTLEEAVRLSNDRDLRREIAQVRAKSTLIDLADEVPEYRWNYVANRVARNATAILFKLTTADSEALRRIDVMEAARTIAQAWEALARLAEGTNRTSALINAAVSYELAGYQANSSCLSRQVAKAAEVDSVVALAATFLQRTLVPLAQPSESYSPQRGLSDEKLWLEVSHALFREGLRCASRHFLSGDAGALDRAEQVLIRAEEGFTSIGVIEPAHLAFVIRELLPVMSRRSIWSNVWSVVVGNHVWTRYLKLLARGVGEDVIRSKSGAELWPSQIAALEGGLLSERTKVVRMPTSAGKTRIAELAIAHSLVTHPGSKCVYIAPFRSLVTELQDVLLNLFSDLGFRVSSIAGSYESDGVEELLATEADVLVLTPEKLDLLQRFRPDTLAQVNLVVLDEGQIVHDRNRGAKFELLLTRLKRTLPAARFVLLSAVIPDQSLRDFAQWLRGGPEDILASEWRPALQRIARFEWSGDSGVLRYAAASDLPILNEFIPGVVRHRSHPFLNPDTGRMNRPRFPDKASKSQVAAELAIELVELGPVLIFCPQTNFVQSAAAALATRLRIARLAEERFPGAFPSSPPPCAAVAAEWLGEDHPVTKMLSQGIAIHHGLLPDAVRKAVERDFRDRRCPVIIATNTLAQGVNLPIRTVVMHSVWRRYSADEQERIPAREYWNIAGRAGRAGQETEGLIVHLCLTAQDRRDFSHYLRTRDNLEPVESALLQRLEEMASGRLSEAALSADLDADVMALMVEEAIGPSDILFSDRSSSIIGIETTSDSFDGVLDDSLVGIQAAAKGLDLAPLSRALRASGMSIRASVPDPERRQLFSTTGLKSGSCLELQEALVARREAVEPLLRACREEEAPDLADLLVECCTPLAEMQPRFEFTGSLAELLRLWLGGRTIADVATELEGEVASDNLARLVDDLLCSKLPWGFSSAIRIAERIFDLSQNEFSVTSRSLPAMVKFGVPNSNAAWAMSAGIPLRSTAIKLAASFGRDDAPASDFLEWLGRIGSDELRHEYGLSGDALFDVARTLSRAGRNRYLARSARLDDHLPATLPVRGIGYEGREALATFAKVGRLVSVLRDYENLVDRNAILLEFRGKSLGYLPRDFAQLIAPEMDSGSTMVGRVSSLDLTGRIPQVSVEIRRA